MSCKPLLFSFSVDLQNLLEGGFAKCLDQITTVPLRYVSISYFYLTCIVVFLSVEYFVLEKVFQPPTDSVSSLSFSPKTNLFVATSWDNQANNFSCFFIK